MFTAHQYFVCLCVYIIIIDLFAMGKGCRVVPLIGSFDMSIFSLSLTIIGADFVDIANIAQLLLFIFFIACQYLICLCVTHNIAVHFQRTGYWGDYTTPPSSNL